MLAALSIRDVVLIERLALTLNAGLCVLTGETGAGKSILLDALGLALGSRGDSTLVRHGSDQASVTAEFDLPDDHPAIAMVREQGLEVEDTLVLRRVVTADGRSRAYVNDQAVGVTLLRRLGETLVEVHGQFDTHGLLNPQTHRSVLDAYAGLQTSLAQVGAAYRAWRQVEVARKEAAAEISKARAEEEYLRHSVAELDAVGTARGRRGRACRNPLVMMHREKVVEAMNGAFAELAGERGAERGLNAAQRALMRIVDKAGGRLEPVIGALDRAMAEVGRRGGDTPGAFQRRGSGPARAGEAGGTAVRAPRRRRKHNIAVDKLALLREDMSRRLNLIEDQGDALERLAREAELAREAYLEAAKRLSGWRREAATKLDAAVSKELPPLKLDKARFTTTVEPLEEFGLGSGRDRPGGFPGRDQSRFASGADQ